ncbi:MAG: rRNA maturation RNase YbeY [Dehalococcoidia bacterium]
MQSDHDVLVSIDPRFSRQVSADWLVGIARITLEMEKVGVCQLGVVVTDDEQIRLLNREYAGEDHATDVLAFSLTEGEDFAKPDETERIGEVVISMETAVRQAEDAKIDLESEIAHLLVHGVLHLRGYDHLGEDEERVMRAKERAVLVEVGLSAH